MAMVYIFDITIVSYIYSVLSSYCQCQMDISIKYIMTLKMVPLWRKIQAYENANVKCIIFPSSITFSFSRKKLNNCMGKCYPKHY